MQLDSSILKSEYACSACCIKKNKIHSCVPPLLKSTTPPTSPHCVPLPLLRHPPTTATGQHGCLRDQRLFLRLVSAPAGGGDADPGDDGVADRVASVRSAQPHRLCAAASLHTITARCAWQPSPRALQRSATVSTISFNKRGERGCKPVWSHERVVVVIALGDPHPPPT